MMMVITMMVIMMMLMMMTTIYIYCNVILGNGIHIHLCRKVLLATSMSCDDDENLLS